MTRSAEWLGYQLAAHPRLARAAVVTLVTHLLAVWAVVAAPPAVAATMAGALGWTGVTDSHGVPLGAYYLSVVSTTEAITQAGPGLSADPSSWAHWLASAVTTGLTHDTVASWLQAQAAVYVLMISVALWLLRFALSSTWLAWLATWCRPLLEAIRSLMAQLSVVPICLLLGLAVGVYNLVWHGHRGRGWSIILSAFALGVVGLALTRNPLGELDPDHGVLTTVRGLGFSVAQAAMNNGPITSGGTGTQVQSLTGFIADATIRTPLQLWNFGTPVDGIGTCGPAWSAAILTGDPAAPAHAMTNCGAPQALSYAQHLDGSNVALGIFYCLLGAVFTFFVSYVAYSYVLVVCAAFLHAILMVMAAPAAMIAGPPRRAAVRRATQFVKSAVLVFAYVTYISIAAMIVLKTAAPGGYAAQVGMTHPVAVLVMIAIISAVATGLFIWLKRELRDGTRHDLTHTLTDLLRQGRNGYDRGRRRDQTGRPAPTDPADRSRPRTGTPVNGRDPSPRRGAGRRPPSGPAPAPGREATPNVPLRTSKPGATTAARAGTHTRAAQAVTAATDVTAPEAAVAAAVAAQTHHQRRRGRSSRDITPPSAQVPIAPHPVGSPAPGRSLQQPSDARARTPDVTGPRPPIEDPLGDDGQPVAGREA
ncbi:uncharacterized protein YggT (Ycf19 family) [Mycolicibacterium sp. BK556]|uniref:hypothetical protein n=1 Tax=unclassified Mycolicibacterium TaxID=2636767 RepID=UPI00161C233A|nr:MULTISPECIES: hypothetical protein [unclassified Mycolicibacterium]MBB3606423.1 uncharacterized protein YggT (Ycf19 family) [Mycolicibacterium sp. BK556]MBB3636331.1 uncharacterized protein YggT (Ycf19 family) [Mycolicibacterium sp. BK607]